MTGVQTCALPICSVDPVRDKEIIDTELQLKDLETIESRMQKAQTGGDKVARQTYEVLVRYREALCSVRMILRS